MSDIVRLRSTASALAFALCAVSAHAAGGHFDVDDATVVEPQHCQIEAWTLGSPSESANTRHLGGACRIGPVEAGLNIDRARVAGSSLNTLGPQLKWVMDPMVERLSAGIVWAVSIDTGGGQGPSHTLYLPLTLWGGERLQLHANAGLDWTAGELHTRRWGYAAEWAANDLLSVIAEHSLIARMQTSRIGTRFNLGPSLSLDLTLAHRTSAGRAAYGVGLNRDFDLH